ncbi:uncharacterized protein LOC134240788 [Saccostrea cucullata]|uniref:uncharacterized protein LOC134240788 n=1 Tax=Saccostrea cuccullata TaxID=36930 RepID=UPI002ED30E48
MTDFNEVIRNTQSPKCRLILSILFSTYAKKAMSEFKPRDLSLIIDRCLECAIENQNHILILEIVRSYVLDFDFHLCKLFKGKKRISFLVDTFLNTALYILLRECPRLQQNAIRLSFCCECSKESRLVIMMLYKGSIEMKDGTPEKVMGVNLVLYNYTHPSDEAHTVFNSSSASFSSTNLPVIPENDARKLFKKHSNLTLISASPYKSSGYSKGKHVIIEKHCISLLCLHKGFIPFGEREFPKQINGFEVDVQEGYCLLGSGKSIDFGGHIRRARGVNNPGNGSIGGFVDLPDGSVGLITCAHVVFSTDELNVPNTELENYVTCRGTDFKAEFFDKNKHKFQVCGNIVDKRFPLSMNDNAIDAALIKLDPTVNEFGFPVALASQLYSAGFDPDISPVFNGEVVTLQDPYPIHNVGSRFPDRLDSVIKYGSQSGFTIGNLYFDGAHIRFLNESLGLPDQINIVSMYNQIEIQSLPHGAFFEVGDSGAFVFCINPDKTLSCLGMAIGLTTRGSCLVTPMVRILDSFGLPHTLKPCSSFCPRNNSSGSQDPTGSQSEQQNNNASSSVDLGAILLNLQTSITSMQSSIMGVQNQQTSIQTSLQSVQAEVGNLKAQVQADVWDLKAQIQELKDEIHTNSSTGLLDINQN